MTLRELNRTLLLRQLLLERKRLSPLKVVDEARRAAGAVRALAVRRAVVADRGLPQGAADPCAERRADRQGGLAAHDAARDVGGRVPVPGRGARSNRSADERIGWVSTWRCCAPHCPTSRSRAPSSSSWVTACSGQTIAGRSRSRTARCRSCARTPVGAWPHTKPSPFALWREPLPEAWRSAVRVVRQYLAAYGPATRETSSSSRRSRSRQIDPALEGLPTTRRRRGADALRRSARAARGGRCSRAGSLPAGLRLDHPRASRSLADRPARVRRRGVQQANATTKNTFTVDGLVAGAWRVERKRLVLEPFAPLPLRVRREVDVEGERLLAWYLG